MSIYSKSFQTANLYIEEILITFIAESTHFPAASLPPILYSITMKSTIVRRELPNGDILFSSEVLKKSNTGVTENRRLLLLIEDKCLGYLTNPILQSNLSLEYFKQKAKGGLIPFSSIKKISPNGGGGLELTIEFVQQKPWTFKMASFALLDEWLELLDRMYSRSRKGTVEKGHIDDPLPNEAVALPANTSSKFKNVVNTKNNTSSTSKLEAQPPVVISRSNTVNETPRASLAPIPTLDIKSSELERLKKDYDKVEERRRNIISSEISQIQATPPKNNYFSAPREREKEYSFLNYLRPYTHSKEQSIKYSRFVEYSKTTVTRFVNSLTAARVALCRKDHELLVYNEPPDVELRLCLTGLKMLSQVSSVCDNSMGKTLLNQTKNMEYIYQVIRRDQLLSKVFFLPMTCLVYYKGFSCVVTSKVVAAHIKDVRGDLPSTDVSKMFELLATNCKLSFDMFQNQNCIQFLPINTTKSKFIVMSSKECLPALESTLLLRKEAFRHTPIIYHYQGTRKQNEEQLEYFKREIDARVGCLAGSMDKLDCYPMHTRDFTKILHSHGINIKHIALLLKSINHVFIRNILITEAAVRTIKLIFNKKIQDYFVGRTEEGHEKDQQNMGKALLNVLLGRSKETDLLWKVVVLHSQKYFGMHVDSEMIDRSYFLLGLQHHLRIKIDSGLHASRIFETNSFVNSIRFRCDHKGPILFGDKLSCLQESWGGESMGQEGELEGIEEISGNEDMAAYVKDRESLCEKIKLYQCFAGRFRGEIVESGCSLLHFKRRLMNAKWLIKEGVDRNRVLLQFKNIRKDLDDIYGKCHPFHSETLELLALYHSECPEGDYSEQAIEAQKQSLSNMIQCCGSNTQHIKLSNSHFLLAQSYQEAYLFDEAITSYKRAKNILEINQYSSRLEYALVLHRLALLYLTQFKDKEANQTLTLAINIYEATTESDPADLITLYEDAYRCTTHRDVIAQKSLEVLTRILAFQEAELSLTKRVLAMTVEQVMSLVLKNSRSILRAYLLELCRGEEEIQIDYILREIRNRAFRKTFQAYAMRIEEMIAGVTRESKLKLLDSNRRNQQIAQFSQFMKQLSRLLGEGFLSNVI